MSYRQRVPRPPDAERVEPEAAFSRLAPDATRALVRADAVERAFEGSVPAGGGASGPGATGDVGGAAGARGRMAAAVLLPLIASERESERERERDSGAGDAAADRAHALDIVVIRRSSHLRSNPGELAFPGGRVEPGETAAVAALRETYEEVGIHPSLVRILGALPPVSRASRPEPIAAFVGTVEGQPSLLTDPMEVDAVMRVPLVELADPSRYWEEIWLRTDGQRWRMSFFDLGTDVLWGASARMLVSFFERLTAPK